MLQQKLSKGDTCLQKGFFPSSFPFPFFGSFCHEIGFHLSNSDSIIVNLTDLFLVVLFYLILSDIRDPV